MNESSTLKENNKMKDNLIMPKHSLFKQRRERIKGWPIAKRNQLIRLVYYSFLNMKQAYLS